jgi:hypothetical protein
MRNATPLGVASVCLVVVDAIGPPMPRRVARRI